ncbi:hypothetical protein GCM10018789_59780 [Streptomyces werraensis]|nr:hypothetical protein GCM10018789_59780 [Streptomyces werraensis]
MQCGQELGRQRAACRIRDQGDDLDALGGLFTYAPEKQLYYAVEAEAVLGHGGAQLAQQAKKAEQAVQGFSDPTAPNWAFGDLASSQCNLALVRRPLIPQRAAPCCQAVPQKPPSTADRSPA